MSTLVGSLCVGQEFPTQSSRCGTVETNPTTIHENVGLIPGGLTHWVKHLPLPLSCGEGHRHGSDLTLLWLWCRPVAVALIRPLAWESPYATGEP